MVKKWNSPMMVAKMTINEKAKFLMRFVKFKLNYLINNWDLIKNKKKGESFRAKILIDNIFIMFIVYI